MPTVIIVYFPAPRPTDPVIFLRVVSCCQLGFVTHCSPVFACHLQFPPRLISFDRRCFRGLPQVFHTGKLLISFFQFFCVLTQETRLDKRVEKSYALSRAVVLTTMNSNNSHGCIALSVFLYVPSDATKAKCRVHSNL